MAIRIAVTILIACWLSGAACAGVDPAVLADLLAKAKADGKVRVLVRLNTPFQLESGLGAAAIEDQQSRVKQAQDTIEQAVAGPGTRIGTRFKFVPGMAVETDEWGLKILAGLPETASITENVADDLALASSTEVIGAPPVWAEGYLGEGQVVAVLDSGVDGSHSFFGYGDKIVSEACYSSNLCPGGMTASTAPGSGAACSPSIPGCDHGTHVAGIATGRDDNDIFGFRGVASEAGVIAIQIARSTYIDCPDRNGDGEPDPPCLKIDRESEIAGLDRVWELRNTFDIAAVNMSIAGHVALSDPAICDGISPLLTDAIATLRQASIPTVIASGNDQYTYGISYPSCISHAISVGATYDNDLVTIISNVAEIMDLFAPGHSVSSSVPGGWTTAKNGTSMAAPHVAGAFAVLSSADPTAPLEKLVSTVIGTGVPVDDQRPSGIVEDKPRLDLGNAVNVWLAGRPRFHHYRLIDDDGVVNPGETIELRVAISNADRDLHSTTGTLSTSLTTALVTDGFASWADSTKNRIVFSEDTYWIEVAADHPCGEPLELELTLESTVNETLDIHGTWSSTFQIPVGVPEAVVIAADDLESGTGQWTQESALGNHTWVHANEEPVLGFPNYFVDNNTIHSSSHSWRIVGVDPASDTRLTWNEIADLPPNSRLSFNMFVETVGSLDGVVLEYSTDGGSNWSNAEPLITSFGYNSRMYLESSLIRGYLAWSDELGGWHRIEADLSTLAGQDVMFRWRFITHDFAHPFYDQLAGWWLDDIVVESIVGHGCCVDQDRDGFWQPTTLDCGGSDASDCNDTRNDVYPGATESCDGIDNDCDGLSDEQVVSMSPGPLSSWTWTSVDGGASTWHIADQACTGDTLASQMLVSNGNRGPDCISDSSAEHSKLISPPLSVVAGDRLRFAALSWDEAGLCLASDTYDAKDVGVSIDGGETYTVLNDCSQLADGTGTPTEHVFDLSAFAGQTVQIVIAYKTQDELQGHTFAVGDFIIETGVTTDPDLDGFGMACDNCPDVSNVFQVDLDGDGLGDACDCAPGDETNGLPLAVQNLLLTHVESTDLSWAAAPGGAGFEVVGGDLGLLRAMGSVIADSCGEAGLVEPEWTDLSPDPAPGTGRFYLVRAENGCGYGPYGPAGGGLERDVNQVCP